MLVVALGFFSCVAFFFYLVLTTLRRTRVAKAQAEIQVKLLDKFGTSTELLQYLQTDAGQRFLQPEEAPVEPKSPHSRILWSITAGTILTFLGIGLSLLSRSFEEGFVVPGVLCLAIGLGFLVSSAISFYLSKSWGLFNGDKAELVSQAHQD
jgi:hypothetical protein